jgi:hypothetical protein
MFQVSAPGKVRENNKCGQLLKHQIAHKNIITCELAYYAEYKITCIMKREIHHEYPKDIVRGMAEHFLRSQYMWGPIIKYHYPNHHPTKKMPQTIK